MRKTCILLAGLFFAAFSPLQSFAQNNVSDIDITVTLSDDGSAEIVQEWSGTFDEGTENYIPINTSDTEVKNFSVSDESGEYENKENWDVSASFEEKARRCGINETEEGIELCFGISDYGQKKYTVKYTVEGYVKAYTDCDGSNFQLVNSGMNTFPTSVTVRVCTQNDAALTADNTQIWAFGFAGQIEISNGEVLAYTEEPLTGDDSVIIMLGFSHGLLNPVYTSEKSFEDVKDEAFAGSDYTDEDDTLILTVFAVIFLIAAVILTTLLVREMKRRGRIKRFIKEAPYFREQPCGGDLYMTHFLSRKFFISNRDSRIMGAALMKMFNEGFIGAETKEKETITGKTKKEISLRLVKEPQESLLCSLYKILTSAAGEDGILQEKELEKYARRKPDKVQNFIDKAIGTGEQHFKKAGGYKKPSKNDITNLTEEGKRYLSQTAGLRNYLREFSLISEREIEEGIIWKDYIVYATLFGIADKVMEQMKKVYPDRVEEISEYNRQIIILGSYSNAMYSAAQQSIQSSRAAGLGGSSSIGGGGGFSGGGVGGGSR